MNWREIFTSKVEEESVSQIGTDVNDDLIQENRYKVLTPIANPNNKTAMLNISSGLLKASSLEGEVTILNIIELPGQTPLDLAEYRKETLSERNSVQQEMLKLAIEFGKKEGIIINPRILYSRNRFNTINNIVKQEKINFLLLGWRGSFSVGNIYNSLVKNLVRQAPCPVGVLKDNNLEQPRHILVPYRGSEHAHWGVEVAQRLAANYQGQVTVLRVVKAGVDAQAEEERALAETEEIITGEVEVNIKVVYAGEVVDGILSESANNNYDLIVMGASKEWRFKNLLFGSIPDIIADKADTSVLMVRCYDQEVEVIEEEIAQEDTVEGEEPPKF
ncbi:universal stress protein [Natroniella sp. ANB-PHB2]|uniref:universal stress protein n=1 Tax=Natroniella sp. ANB-PHB2 TaxID=3384444 RepID=UPI0038D3C956